MVPDTKDTRKKLNRKQTEMLEVISGLAAQRGISPTLDEIACASGKCKGTVRYYIRLLVRHHYILKHGRFRALQVVASPAQAEGDADA